ncbi:MAG TPA: apolipoprotein N-acyltransferase [Xanthobacteraceae bacterium]|nr:apolipoprotein N-acyltransferase [Xanthobacteraceae bacterium]
MVDSIVLAWGWRRRSIAFIAGAVSALAMAPFNAWPVLFLTFPVLVLLIDGIASRGWNGLIAAADIGWWFGFGYFLAGLYWLGYAFLVDAATFGWLLPFAVLGLPAILAIYTALGVVLARLLWQRGATRILALAVCLTAMEWLRGHAFTGFPWNAFGYALAEPLALAQAASVFGLWGLTFMAIAVCASPATLIDQDAKKRRPLLPFALAALTLAALAGFGAVRLMLTPTQLVDGVHLRIMQPNLQQDVRFNYAAKQEVVERYLALSARPGLDQVTHLIWPESPFPFFLTREADAFAQIAQGLPQNTFLFTGAMRLADPDNPAQSGVYNSIYVIDHQASIRAVYDKVHLVPFGEYLPFEDLLERIGLQTLTEQRGGFLAGDRHRLITVPGAPSASPLICYEIIFPGELRSSEERPGWIVNVTNDGWFGNSSGPYQHLQQARVTAIEQGLPLVRAANTGISAVVDPVGRIVGFLPLASEGVLDAPLPRSIGAPIYARFGDAPAAALVLIAFVFAIRGRLHSGIAKT